MSENFKNAQTILNTTIDEMERHVFGQRDLLKGMLMGLVCDGHILIEGVPGLAKTRMVNTLAKCCSLTFSRIQFTPDLLPTDITGNAIYNPHKNEYNTRRGPIFGNIILADEINRAPAKVQSALLEAMQEKQVSIANDRLLLPTPFMVLATQNPIEQEGTFNLPEAQVDRFLLKLKISYPDRKDEIKLLDPEVYQDEPVSETLLDAENIQLIKDMVKTVYIDEKIKEYILDLVIATRPNLQQQLSKAQQENKELAEIQPYIETGASPRATLAVAKCAQANALLAGRDYVIPQDVQEVIHSAMRHRIIVSYEAEAEDITTDDIIDQILQTVKTP